MANESLEKWRAEAMGLEAFTTTWSLPVHVMLAEAADTVAFARGYWEPSTAEDGTVKRPGLQSSRLKKKTINELLELVEAGQQAHTAHVLTLPTAKGDELERGRWLVSEISAALEYHADDGVEDAFDAQLAQVLAEHQNEPDTAAALAIELADYVALAEPLREALQGVGDFDVACLDEASALVSTIRARLAPTGTVPETTTAIELRNRILTLLQARVSEIRSAAKFVFRAHPDIARQATSAYGRRQRALQRRAKAKQQPPAPAAAQGD